MSKVLVTEQYLTDIADAIRKKLHTDSEDDVRYLPSEMSNAIVNIPSELGTVTIIENGIYKASDDNLDGYSIVNVNLPKMDVHPATVFIAHSKRNKNKTRSIPPEANLLYVFSDCLIKDDVTLNDIMFDNDSPNALSLVDNNLLEININPISNKNFVNLLIKDSAFLYERGSDVEVSIPVTNGLVSYMDTVTGMDTIRKDVHLDTGRFEIALPYKFRDALIRGKSVCYVSSYNIDDNVILQVNADSSIENTSNNSPIKGSFVIEINYSDNSMSALYSAMFNINGYGDVFKIRYEGCDPYSAQTNFIWELFLFRDGGTMIYEIEQGVNNSGSFKFYSTTYTPLEAGTVKSFYSSNGVTTVVDEIYQMTSNVPKFDLEFPINLTFNDLIDLSYNDMELLNDGFRNDDTTFDIKFNGNFVFPFNGQKNTFVRAIDAAISMTSGTIRFGNGDTSTIKLSDGIFYLTDIGLKTYRINVLQSFPFSQTEITHHFEVYLFENGDIMILPVLINDSINKDYNVFNKVTFVPTAGKYVSFYQNEGSFEVDYDIYDINKHITKE